MKVFRFAAHNLILLTVYLSIIGSTNSCDSDKPGNTPKDAKTEKTKKVFTLDSPGNKSRVDLGSPVTFSFSSKDSIAVDSVLVYCNGELLLSEKTAVFTTDELTREVGLKNYRIRIHYPDGKVQNLSTELRIFAAKEPQAYPYKVLRTIPHDEKDYTQGYFYLDAYLYESTGQKGHSRLIKTDPASGKVLMEHRLDAQYFGEGLTSIGNKIYQLTWLSKKGFVYNLETFELESEFKLTTNEGWGLTTDGKDLILSDGSARLYFYDPDGFVEKRQLFVANNQQLVRNLNELEYRNGAVWANILYNPVIIKIDIQTGAVLGRVDLSGLFPKNLPEDGDHVLNGIAYNPDNDSFFVTGKYWPIAYEIRIIEHAAK
ncbi:MAG: glutaminyl-peptide cyclotransferase [Bacteroidales bacterium]|nr:glutaminyl-peptide cyclotransferase [Bacteroidales bacterium]